MMKKRLRNGNGGFTLLEVILSIAILGLVAVPLMKYFSDSLRYTALTEQKQKATMLAQDTLEFMKSKDKLIERKVADDGTVYYWVPSMAGKDETATDGAYTAVSYSGFDKSNGTTAADSPLVLKRTALSGTLSYDVVVEISTSVDANTVARPIIYGIDDTKNVMIVERDEEQEALIHFLALNTSYMAKKAAASVSPSPAVSVSPLPSPSGSPAASPAPSVNVLTSTDDVRKLLQREVFIEIGKEGPPTNYYTVQAYYEYFCENITDKSKDTFRPGDLVNTRIENLEAVYLLMNMVDTDKDLVHINWNVGALPASSKEAPEFVIVCQNLDQLKGSDPAATPDPAASATPVPVGTPDPDAPFEFSSDKYHLKLELNNMGGWPGDGGDPLIRSNILDDDVNKCKGSIKRSDGLELHNNKALTSSSEAVRLLSLKVSVYKAGDYTDPDNHEDPLVEMITTKGE